MVKRLIQLTYKPEYLVDMLQSPFVGIGFRDNRPDNHTVRVELEFFVFRACLGADCISPVELIPTVRDLEIYQLATFGGSLETFPSDFGGSLA